MYEYQAPEFHVLTPATEIENRLAGLQRGLDESGVDAALLVYPVDLLYFSGTLQTSHLLIPAKADSLLMVKRDLARASVESSIKDITGLTGFSRLPGLVNERLGGAPRVMGLELDVLPVNHFKKYQSLWPETEFIDISPMIMEIRAVKSEWELGRMREAGRLSEFVYGRVPGNLREGMSEMDLAGLMTADAYSRGHQNILRARGFGSEVHTWHVISDVSGGIVSSIDASFGGYGVSPAFPVGAGVRPIKRNASILIDFGLCITGYQVDLTRMFSLGRPPERLWEAYEALQIIERELTGLLRPGARAGDLFEASVDTADRLGFGDHFLGTPGRKVKFSGHGLGLEISEPPLLAQGDDTIIKAGMTTALELKMVFTGLGAVGLENTFAVTGGEPENLSPADSTWIVLD